MELQGVPGAMWAPLTDGDTRLAPGVRVPCKPGDAVYFNSCAPYHSLPNRTAQSRRVLYITYNKLSEGDSRVQYHADMHKNLPPDIERDPDNDYRFKV